MFAMFHPQTTEIQPFKYEFFSTKTFKIHYDGVIIYEVSRNFVRYVQQVFHEIPMCKIRDTCIFDVFFLTKRQRFQNNDVIIYDVIRFFEILLNVGNKLKLFTYAQNFIVICILKKKIQGERHPPSPFKLIQVRKPITIRVENRMIFTGNDLSISE